MNTPTASRSPVRPRDAASLILIREDAGNRQVLMGRRRSRTRFVPGYYVFPGGTVDACDRRALPASQLAPGIARMLAVHDDEARARTLAMAAVRETYEETGLILGEPGDTGNTVSESWAAFRKLGLAAALGRLTYAGRAITPSFSPMRFHARFFMATERFTHGSLRHGGELEDLRWVPLTEARQLPIIDVTEFMLDYVDALLDTPAGVRLGRPLFAYRNDIPYVRYIGGPAPEDIHVVVDRTGLK